MNTGVHSIPGLVEGAEGKPLRAAMEQVAGYASAHGVAPALVCNGTQLVAFLAARTDGIAPLRGRALVFTSLDDMRSDFRRTRIPHGSTSWQWPDSSGQLATDIERVGRYADPEAWRQFRR